MIWYDVATKAPVAPGACEDGGLPSIGPYQCPKCKNTDEVAYTRSLRYVFGFCINCGEPLIVQG